jgi:hypothetical protein
MKKMMIYLDEDMHEDLRLLAFRRKTTMAALVRYALDATFEDELDEIGSQRALEEAAAHPEEVVTLDEYLEQRGIALPSRADAAREARPRKVAEGRARYGGKPSGGARR